MTLEAFLTVIAGEIVEIVDNRQTIYAADKNAIRANKAELLQREIYRVEPHGLTAFTVYLQRAV